MSIPRAPVKAARLLVTTRPRTIGTARLNLTRGSVETVHHAMFACGAGLDAEVVQTADREPYRKYRFGSLHYARTALGVSLRAFPRVRPHVTVTADGESFQVAAALVQFRSVYTYFGRVPIRVSPEPPDPMTLLTLTRLRRARIPRIVATLARGGDLGSVPGMDTVAGVSRVDMEADPPVAMQADGEPLGMVDRAVVEWVPDSIRVIAPQSLPR